MRDFPIRRYILTTQNGTTSSREDLDGPWCSAREVEAWVERLHAEMDGMSNLRTEIYKLHQQSAALQDLAMRLSAETRRPIAFDPLADMGKEIAPPEPGAQPSSYKKSWDKDKDPQAVPSSAVDDTIRRDLETRIAQPDIALADMLDEMKRARTKFPSRAALFTALCEEVGELARELDGPTMDPARVRAEALQVACVAMRIATEGIAPETESEATRMAAILLERIARAYLEMKSL